MLNRSLCSGSLAETDVLWETVVVEESAGVRGIKLDVLVGFISGDPPIISPGSEKKVGRTSKSQIRVPLDAKVSRTHWSIECCDDHGVVCDLGSTNGTFVNGRAVQGETKVYEGDLITAGNTTLVVRLLAP